MIDIEAKIDEILIKILREKVNEYFEGPKPERLIKAVKDPGKAIQRIQDDIDEVDGEVKGIDPRTVRGIKKLKDAMRTGARTRASIAEIAGLSSSVVHKYIHLLVKKGEVEKHPEKGYILVE